MLIFSHDVMSGLWYSSPDAKNVRELFKKYSGTVRLSVNGHLHTDHFAVFENVAYFDVNTVYNGFWAISEGFHYDASHMFDFTDYYTEGNRIGRKREH